MSIILGSRVEDAPRPRFHASIDGESAIVELDSSAVLRLAEQAVPPALASVLDEKRDQIRAAAARLAAEGFVTRKAGCAEIVITALDL